MSDRMILMSPGLCVFLSFWWQLEGVSSWVGIEGMVAKVPVGSNVWWCREAAMKKTTHL